MCKKNKNNNNKFVFYNKTGISQKMGAQNPYWKFVLGMCKHDKLLLYYNIIRFSFSKKDVLMC